MTCLLSLCDVLMADRIHYESVYGIIHREKRKYGYCCKRSPISGFTTPFILHRFILDTKMFCCHIVMSRSHTCVGHKNYDTRAYFVSFITKKKNPTPSGAFVQSQLKVSSEFSAQSWPSQMKPRGLQISD